MSDDRTLTVIPQPHGGALIRGNPGGRTPKRVSEAKRALRKLLKTAPALLNGLLADPDPWLKIAAIKLLFDFTLAKPKPPRPQDSSSADLIAAQGELARMQATARRVIEALKSHPQAQQDVLKALDQPGEPE